MDESELLDGWKEIASYLGRSVRSAQRWESQLALPVHRIPTPDGGQLVYARRGELDAWRARQDALDTNGHEADPNRHRDQPAASRRWMLGVSLLTVANLAAAAVLLATWYDSHRGPASYEIAGRSVRAVTPGGRALWMFDAGRPVSAPSTLRGGRAARPADLEGDGRPGVVVAVREGGGAGGGSAGDAIYALGPDGSLRWRVVPDLVLRDNTREFRGPWIVRALMIDESNGRTTTYAAFTHASWRPSFVLRIDADGTSEVAYLQDGWVYALATWEMGGEHYLAAGGNVAGHDRPSVALLPRDAPGARLEVDPDNPLRCDGCPEQPPARLVLLPNTDVTRAIYRPFGWVWMLRVMDGQLRVSVDAGFGEGTIAHLDSSGAVVDYRFAARYWEAHRQLFDEHRLDHPADGCPDLHTGQIVDEWTPTATWRRYVVMPSHQMGSDEVRPAAD